MEVSKWQQADSNTLGTVVTGRLYVCKIIKKHVMFRFFQPPPHPENPGV